MPTVLIVESDPIGRNLLRDIFSRNGFMVLDAVNHREGMHLLRVLEKEEIDLLVVNPDGNVAADTLGRDVFALRPGAKILFTPDGHMVDSSYMAVPGSAILRQPFTEARLLEVVSALLEPTTQ